MSNEDNLRDGFIAYIDDTEKIVRGMCAIQEINKNQVCFYTNDNFIVIPMHRVLKVKINNEEVKRWKDNKH